MKPTKAFSIASGVALATGSLAYLVGLYNATMMLNEKGYYFAVLLLGLFGVVSLQKSVRDKLAGIMVTKPYMVACVAATVAGIALLVIGLVNADLLLSEKGFFGMAYTLSLFAAIAVQKNVRDSAEVTD